MGLFLTAGELAELTGRQTPAAQRRWLDRNGFSYRIAADGHIRLLRAHVVLLMGGTASAGEAVTQPDFSALSRLA